MNFRNKTKIIVAIFMLDNALAKLTATYNN